MKEGRKEKEWNGGGKDPSRVGPTETLESLLLYQEILNSFSESGGPEVDLLQDPDRIRLATELEMKIREFKSQEGCRDVTEVYEDEEWCYHLVQEDETVAELLDCAVPPPEYYEKLLELWEKWFPKSNVKLREHMISVLEAFDTATVFALSLGIAKFDLAQHEAKLVGEIVGRTGRSPNPAICRAIRNWPPIYTLKQLQEFLGTVNYVRPHCGPEYARIADPLRDLLKPGAVFPPNQAQLDAIDKLKSLVEETHRLAVPDERAAIQASNAWLAGAPPEGRPTK